jgi:hypothetical protein
MITEIDLVKFSIGLDEKLPSSIRMRFYIVFDKEM